MSSLSTGGCGAWTATDGYVSPLPRPCWRVLTNVLSPAMKHALITPDGMGATVPEFKRQATATAAASTVAQRNDVRPALVVALPQG